MNPFFAYLIKSSVSLALFYIVFKLTVSRDKMHSVNRFVLLGILIVSAIIPFADIPLIQETQVIPKVEIFREFVAQPVFHVAPVFESIQSTSETKSIDANPYMFFYILIIFMLFIRLLISTIRVMQIIRAAEKRPFRKIVLAVVKDFIQPFTFLNKVVISEKDFTKNREIIVTHEYAHIQYLHAIDLMVCTLFTALHWFNPFMWFLRHDLKLIHEFQADQAVLNNGIDVKEYQLLVLEKSVGERRFAMANYFLQKPILKRLEMMKKKTKNHWKGVKLILFIPMILLLLQAFAQPEIVVKKAGVLVPVITQQDKAEKWLEMWTVENIKNGNLHLEKNYSISHQKNTFTILMNSRNDFLIEGKRAKKENIKELVKVFLDGKQSAGENAPDYIEKEFPLVGKVKVSQGIIFFQHDRTCSKTEINFALRSIGEAYLETRQEKAEELFSNPYFLLNDEKQEVINKVVPIRFSVPKPKVVKPPPPPKKTIETEEQPVVVILDHNWLGVNNKKCHISELNKIVENHIVQTGSQRIIEFKISESTSEERIEEINNELNKIEGIKVIKKVFPGKKEIDNVSIRVPPPAGDRKITQALSIFMKADGEKTDLETISKKAQEFMKKYGGEHYTVSIIVQEGVSKEEVNQVKEVFRKAGVTKVNIKTMK